MANENALDVLRRFSEGDAAEQRETWEALKAADPETFRESGCISDAGQVAAEATFADVDQHDLAHAIACLLDERDLRGCERCGRVARLLGKLWTQRDERTKVRRPRGVKVRLASGAKATLPEAMVKQAKERGVKHE